MKRRSFVELVNEALPTYRGDWVVAWSQTRKLHPEMYREMMEDGHRGTTALANGTQDSTRFLPPSDQALKVASDAQAEFENLVAEYEQKRKVPYSTAWRAVAALHPKLIQDMHQGSGRQTRAFAAERGQQGNDSAVENSAAMAAASATPPYVTGPGAALLGLWPGVDQSIFNAAWRANGNKMPNDGDPLKAAKVFEAVAKAIAKRDNISLEAAIEKAKTGVANWLWKSVQAAAGEKVME